MTNSRRAGDDEFVSRRTVLTMGAKKVWIVPAIWAFSASEAIAAGSAYGCYAVGHPCIPIIDEEPCCDGLTCELVVNPDIFECQ